MIFAFRYLVSRIVKIFANLTKVACLLHFRLFPRARFTIPFHAPALIRRTSPRRIPRVVVQTNYSNEVTLAVYLCYLFNRLMAADHEFYCYGDDAARAWVADNYGPEVAASYNRIQIGAAIADYWRVLMLLRHGGVYLDMDACFPYPPSPQIGADDEELLIHYSSGEVTNYFMAAAPGHPFFAMLEQTIRANIAANTLTSVYEMTGPDAMLPALGKFSLNIKLYKTICLQGQFTREATQYPAGTGGKWRRLQEERPILR